MRCVYELNAIGTCPVNGARDRYDIKVVAEQMIQVEELIKHFSRKGFQEDLTEQAAQKFCAIVSTIGTHSGVKVECTASPRFSHS